MVSTRRSRSTAGDGNSAEQDGTVEGLSQQTEVSSRRARKSTSMIRAHAALNSVAEEPAAAAAAEQQVQDKGIPRQEIGQKVDNDDVSPQMGTSPQRQQQQQPQSLPEQQPAATPANARTTRHREQPLWQQHQVTSRTVQLAPSNHAIDASHDATTDSDDADWDFDGPDMLQNLAASIRSALGSTRGVQEQQQNGQKHIAAAAAAGRGHDGVDLESLRWRPSTGLQLPRKAAQLVQSAVASLPPKQQHELATSGPTVQLPSHAEQQVSADAPEAAAVVTKPHGLARHTRVPTLDPSAAAKEARKQKSETAGKKWFDLPAVNITDEVKRDLRLLRLRGAYDPKRFYKSFDETKFPKHFAVGTVVDDPLDFYGGRLTKGQRKASLTEQLLADSELTTSRKKRYSKLQEDANKWVKHKKRKTDKPRKTPPKHRPKH